MKKVFRILGLLALFAASVSMVSCKHASSSDDSSDSNGKSGNPATSNEGTEFSISYNANGGTGSISAQKVGIGEEATLSDAAGLSKDGDFFAGWDTKADGKGDSYEAGAKVLLAESVTLYAQWLPAEAKEAFEAVKFGDDDDNPAAFSGEVALSGADEWALEENDFCELASPAGFMASAQTNKILKLKSGVPSVTIMPRKATLTAKFGDYTRKFTVRQKFAEYVMKGHDEWGDENYDWRESYRFDGAHFSHINERKYQGDADFSINYGTIRSYKVSGGTMTMQKEKEYVADEELLTLKPGWYDKAGMRKVNEEWVKEYPEEFEGLTMADIDAELNDDFAQKSFAFKIEEQTARDDSGEKKFDWVKLTCKYDASKKWWQQNFGIHVRASEGDKPIEGLYSYCVDSLELWKNSLYELQVNFPDEGYYRTVSYKVKDFNSTQKTFTGIFDAEEYDDGFEAPASKVFFSFNFDESAKKLTITITDADTEKGKSLMDKKSVFYLGNVSAWVDEIY